MEKLKERMVRGGVVKVAAQAANAGLRLATLIVLARLLGPRDFGLVGMVTAITGVLTLFKEFGLSAATVQKADISDEQVSALFWINILVGVTLCLTSLAIAPFVAAFYGEPRLSTVMAVVAVGFLFNAAGVQHSALLQRQMRFATIALIEMLSLVGSSAVSILMALGGYGYWALVAWTVTLPLVATILAWTQSRWIPGRPRRCAGIRSLMRFGGTVTLNSVIVYFGYNLDKVLLGRFAGAEVVGIYGRAYQLIALPTDNLTAAIGGVAFPVLSRLQRDPTRLKVCFLNAYALVLAVTVPITIGCALFAQDLIPLLLGSRWNDAVQIFQFLAPTILVFALINPPSWLLLALGLVGRSLRLGFVIVPIAITGYVVGLPYGARGVALGFSTAMTLWALPHLWWCFRGTVVSFREVLVVILRPLISGLVGAALAFVYLVYLGPSASPLSRLFGGGAVLAVSYAAVLLLVMGQMPLYLDILRSLRPRPAENALSV